MTKCPENTAAAAAAAAAAAFPWRCTYHCWLLLLALSFSMSSPPRVRVRVRVCVCVCATVFIDLHSLDNNTGSYSACPTTHRYSACERGKSRTWFASPAPRMPPWPLFKGTVLPHKKPQQHKKVLEVPPPPPPPSPPFRLGTRPQASFCWGVECLAASPPHG